MLHDSVSFVNRRTLYRYVHWPEVDTRVIAVASFTGGGSKLNCVIVVFFLLASKISFHIEFIFRYLSESKIMVYLID